MDIVTITDQYTDTIDLRGYGDVRLVLPPNATVKTIIGPMGTLAIAGGPVTIQDRFSVDRFKVENIGPPVFPGGYCWSDGSRMEIEEGITDTERRQGSPPTLDPPIGVCPLSPTDEPHLCEVTEHPRAPCPKCGGQGIPDGGKVICEQCGYSARG